jgi:transmembrane sensor
MPENFRELFDRYIRGQISPDELKQLQRIIQDEKNAGVFSQLLEEAYINPALQINEGKEEAWNEFKYRISGRSKTAGSIRYLKSGWFRAAAVVTILAAVAVIWLITGDDGKEKDPVVQTSTQEDAAPGKQGALLKLADGRVISLDSLGNGLVADANGVAVNLSNGSLSYEKDNSAAVSYNTLSTPNGRQFKLVLPDGSKVWLNAASSIRYPTRFEGKERKVEITGEVYFEITKNAAKSFIVTRDNLDMTVLGTSFNAKLYDNQSPAAITLVTGKLQVQDKRGSRQLVLSPGTQALVHKERVELNSHPDLNDVLAWKEGKFSFNAAGIMDVMNELARWYDISVKYEGNIPQRRFTGKIGMDLQLSEILDLLRKNDIQFSLREKVLYVKGK